MHRDADNYKTRFSAVVDAAELAAVITRSNDFRFKGPDLGLPAAEEAVREAGFEHREDDGDWFELLTVDGDPVRAWWNRVNS